MCRGHNIEADTAGVTVTLIDFTLSRLTAVTGDVAFCDLAADPELFQGPKGDVQVPPHTHLYDLGWSKRNACNGTQRN